MSIRFAELQYALEKSAMTLVPGGSCPVSLRPICKELGVRGIRRDKLQGAKSLLVDAHTHPVIILNNSILGVGARNEKFTRWERFLIAHELGHLVLHQAGAEYPAGRSEYWKLERLCDAFARRLLIPNRVVGEVAAGAGSKAIDHLKWTLRLATNCSVPWSVAARRLGDVDEGTVFFRVAPLEGSEFKVIVSTRPNHAGIGQCVKRGTPLHETVSDQILQGIEPREVDPIRLSGIGGIKDLRSGAACSLEGTLCVAAIGG